MQVFLSYKSHLNSCFLRQDYDYQYAGGYSHHDHCHAARWHDRDCLGYDHQLGHDQSYDHFGSFGH